MTASPQTGMYMAGDASDTHTHIFYVGHHPMDVELGDTEASQLRGDFPKATTSAYFEGDYQTFPHAHSIEVNAQTGELICVDAGDGVLSHTHNVITRVEDLKE